jgi:cardiolipin synthase
VSPRWHDGHRVDLLENGEAFFPRVFAAIREARTSVLVETFILFEDAVGEELRDSLLAAARNGASVDLTVDGYGSPSLSREFLDSLLNGNVRVHVFDPRPPWLGMRTNLLRRMHRKIVVVDDAVAFVGGINYSIDHLREYGAEAKQDYSVEVRGPVVADIAKSARALIGPRRNRLQRLLDPLRRRKGVPPTPAAGSSKAAFVTRDNARHRNDIEYQYRLGIRSARKRVVIANAYFVPGYRLLRALRDAARRGVEVRLILQGQPDLPLVTAASRALYRYLLPAGVVVFEYCRRPLHCKVALVDDEWATVGSSNLDPLSLWFNLEANVLVRDREFNQVLAESLGRLAKDYCTRIDHREHAGGGFLRPLLGVMLFHFLRHFPRYLGKREYRAPVLDVAADAQAEESRLMLSAYATARRPNGMPAMPASTRPSQDLAKADTGKSRRA